MTFLDKISSFFLNERSDSLCVQLCQTRLRYGGYLIRDKNYLPFASTLVHPQFLVGSVLCIVLVFCVVRKCFVCLRPMSCTKCCQYLRVVYSYLPLRFSLTFICHVRRNSSIRMSELFLFNESKCIAIQQEQVIFCISRV